MSSKNLTISMYKCIISCPLTSSVQIPFPEVSTPSSRYVLTSPVPHNFSPYATTNDRHYYALDVIDTQPEQQSQLDENLDKIVNFEKDSLTEVGIPNLAFVYLALAEFNPIIPELLDAWVDKDNEQEIAIVETSNEHLSLKEYCQAKSTDMAKIIDIFQVISKLWKQFMKVNCTSALLNYEQLKISVEGNLVVEQLYLDATIPTIRQLVETWSHLFTNLEDTYKYWLTKLIDKIEQGQINNIKQLQDELKRIAQEVQLQSILEEQETTLEELELDTTPVEGNIDTFAEELNYDTTAAEESEATQVNQNLDEQPTLVLPMKLLSLRDVGLTDIGRRRVHNEDCFAIETQVNKQEAIQGVHVEAKGLFIVCDGMGGHASGEVASAMAIKHLSNYFQQHWQNNQLPKKETIKQAVLLTNEMIYSLNKQKGNSGSGRMGTTLVMTLLCNNKVAIAHVGDSRVYQISRKRGLQLLTIDHCVAQLEIRQGVAPEIAYGRPDAYQLTQALGPRNNSFVQPEIQFFDIKEDTLLLMCSDGLYENDLVENNWEHLLLPLIGSDRNLEQEAIKIIDLANEINGHDNITCVLIRIKVQPNIDHQAAFL